MAYFPIYLWNTIVDPPFVYPKEDIGIEVVVTLKATRFATILPSTGITVYTERRYTEFDPRLNVTHSAVELVYKVIHILSSPSRLACLPATGKPLVVVKLLTAGRIGVEVVVYVQAVYIVTSENIPYYATYMVAVALQSRVKLELPVV